MYLVILLRSGSPRVSFRVNLPMGKAIDGRATF